MPLFQVKIVDWHSLSLESQRNLWESLCICCCVHLRDKLSNFLEQSLEFIPRKCGGLVMDSDEVVVGLKIIVSFCHVSILCHSFSISVSVQSALFILSCKNYVIEDVSVESLTNYPFFATFSPLASSHFLQLVCSTPPEFLSTMDTSVLFYISKWKINYLKDGALAEVQSGRIFFSKLGPFFYLFLIPPPFTTLSHAHS